MKVKFHCEQEGQNAAGERWHEAYYACTDSADIRHLSLNGENVEILGTDAVTNCPEWADRIIRITHWQGEH